MNDNGNGEGRKLLGLLSLPELKALENSLTGNKEKTDEIYGKLRDILEQQKDIYKYSKDPKYSPENYPEGCLIKRVSDPRNGATIVSSLETDQWRLAALLDSRNSRNIDTIIDSLSNPNTQEQLLSNVSSETTRNRIEARLSNDAEKVELLEKFRTDEYEKTKIIASLSSDAEKVELLGDIEDEENRAKIIASLSSDAEKLKLLGDIEDEENRAKIIASLSSDAEKVELLGDIEDEENRAKIIASLSDDAKKIEPFKDISDPRNQLAIIESLNEDDAKKQVIEILTVKMKELTEIIDSYEKAYKDPLIGLDIKKINAFAIALTEMLSGNNLITNVKAATIASLSSDAEKVELLEDIEDEENRAKIIASLSDDAEKVELLEDIKDEKNRAKIIASLKSLNDEMQEQIIGILRAGDESFRAQVLSELRIDDKKKIELLNSGFISDEQNIALVIAGLADDSNKFYLLSGIYYGNDGDQIVIKSGNTSLNFESLSDGLIEILLKALDGVIEANDEKIKYFIINNIIGKIERKGSQQGIINDMINAIAQQQEGQQQGTTGNSNNKYLKE